MGETKSGVQLRPSRAHIEIKSETPNHVGVEVVMEKGTMCAISSCAECFELPASVFEGLSRALGRRKQTGKLTLEFRNGGAAGARFEENLKE